MSGSSLKLQRPGKSAECYGQPPLRLISRLTVEGERPSNLAIDRADSDERTFSDSVGRSQRCYEETCSRKEKSRPKLTPRFVRVPTRMRRQYGFRGVRRSGTSF